MKKVLFLFTFSIFLFSCSNVVEGRNIHDSTEDVFFNNLNKNSETLKDVIEKKESSMSWTKELEGDILQEDIYIDAERISSNVYLTPEVISVVYCNNNPIYPEIPGFGSLDTTLLQDSVRNVINEFAESINENIYTIPISVIHPDFIFNYVFFRNDLIENWELKFGEKFPYDNNEDKSKIKPITLFTKWIIGRPFTTGEIEKVPVRFYCQQGFLDVTLYILLENNKIYQITEGPYDGE